MPLGTRPGPTDWIFSRARAVALLGALAGCGLSEIPTSGRAEPVGPGPAPQPGDPVPVPAPPPADAAAPVPAPPAADAAAPAPGPDAAVPADPGSGVMIAGRFVPRDKAIVILHLGHSNMAGRAQGPADQIPYFYDTHPNLWRYQKGGVWTPAKEWLCPDGGPDPNYPQGAGPGMALLRQAQTVAPPDAHIISIGVGLSVTLSTSCFTFRKGGIHHPKIMDIAAELRGKVTYAGLFVMLGYDGRRNTRAQNGGYIACLKGLAEDFRAELQVPELPFIAGDYERGATGSFSPTSPGAPQVIAQLAMVPAVIRRSFLIPTEGIEMQDNHHFNMRGHRQWAERAFAGMAASGLLPWAVDR